MSQFKFLSFVTIWFLIFSLYLSFFPTILDFLLYKFLSYFFHHKNLPLLVFLPKKIFHIICVFLSENVVRVTASRKIRCPSRFDRRKITKSVDQEKFNFGLLTDRSDYCFRGVGRLGGGTPSGYKFYCVNYVSTCMALLDSSWHNTQRASPQVIIK